MRILDKGRNMNSGSMRVETITPGLAERMLRHNDTNRTLSSRLVKKFVTDIKDNQWTLNGEAIKFDDRGNLIDGQHRLSAVIEAKRPIDTYVVRDLASGIQGSLDQGRIRSLADNLKINGVPYPNIVGTTSRLIASLIDTNGNINARVSYYSNTHMLIFVDAHPEILASVGAVCKLDASVIVGKTPLAAMHYLAAKAGLGREANSMLEIIRTGVPEYPGDPIHSLRERIIRTRAQRSKVTGAGSHLNSLTVLATLSVAFSRYTRGESVNVTKWAKHIITPVPWSEL